MNWAKVGTIKKATKTWKCKTIRKAKRKTTWQPPIASFGYYKKKNRIAFEDDILNI